MLVRFRRSHFACALFAVALCFLNTRLSALEGDDEVVLPTQGTIDERPFFSTRRYPAIEYSDREATDIAGDMVRKVNSGALQLRFEGRSGYLRSILEALHVPFESQTLVFSKTSLQTHYISPATPRAIFFSDEVSVAFIPDAPLLEIAALDPQQGVVFYALSSRQVGKPEIVRSDSCTTCHEGHDTLGVPGFLARSVATGTGGEDMRQFGNYISDHRSPFEERWGGWFITGKSGSSHHMGNVMLEQNAKAAASVVPPVLASMDGKFNLDGYPSHFSDVAAVLVLDHQAGMINMFTRVGWETRIALDQLEKKTQTKAAVDRLVVADAGELVDYMLFVDEAPMSGKFESTSGYPAAFENSAPHDKKGRSLKQLDLGKRLMKYPCSYMIYSKTFDALPGPTKDAVYARLWAILSGQDNARKYSKLSAADRSAIVGILLDTKPNLPSYFKPL